MPLPISLKAVVDEMDVMGDGFVAYIHRTTGELVTIGTEEIEIVEEGDPPEDFPEWQQEMIRKTAEVLSSTEFLELPSKFEIHEYSIMERFCRSVEDEELSFELLDLIRGSGAFRRFKNAIHRHGLTDDWYAYRQLALEEIAAFWLEENNIPYMRP